MPVVGTAGHVDHGKSTLTRALSGRDPDRWAEEKLRGLTIDLGFAWTDLGGLEVSFVDVPGHERYSKNMLAGIEAIDVALVVVAADEGWMPQSEEHLAVLDLLEVSNGVIALSKVDRVDSDLVELAALEIEERLAGTTLEGAPVVGVSAITGEGMEDLRAALTSAVERVVPHRSDRPRLWVDRVFSATGSGTVVTGTLLEGGVSVDDRVTIFPQGITSRIRGIQSHEKSMERVDPQRRVALNLGGTPHDVLERGSMVGRAEDWRPTSRVAVSIRTARYVTELTNRGAYHLHLGSGAWPVRLRQIDDGVAVLDLPQALPLMMGDRFILRDTGRRMVVAGGRILDPAPPRPRQVREHAPRLLANLEADPDSRASALLEVRGKDTAANLAAHSGGGRVLDGVVAGELVMIAAVGDRLGAELVRLVEEYHRDHPLRPGLPSAEASSRLGVEPDTLAVLVSRSQRLDVDGSAVRMKSFAGVRSDAQQRAWDSARARLAAAGAGAVPRIDELEVGIEVIHALAREGELVRISDEFVMLPEQIEGLLATVRSFAEPFTVSEFRERSGLSRKYAVPFLEWSDRTGHSVRTGDTRRPL
jgi:selenocysteine-specific elongation factor